MTTPDKAGPLASGQMHQSYPFLAIAIETGVPYGHVLNYADAEFARRRPNHSGNYWPQLTYWQRQSVSFMPSAVASLIAATVNFESNRRVNTIRG